LPASFFVTMWLPCSGVRVEVLALATYGRRMQLSVGSGPFGSCLRRFQTGDLLPG
jgi:hypothetical protein